MHAPGVVVGVVVVSGGGASLRTSVTDDHESGLSLQSRRVRPPANDSDEAETAPVNSRSAVHPGASKIRVPENCPLSISPVTSPLTMPPPPPAVRYTPVTPYVAMVVMGEVRSSGSPWPLFTANSNWKKSVMSFGIVAWMDEPTNRRVTFVSGIVVVAGVVVVVAPPPGTDVVVGGVVVVVTCCTVTVPGPVGVLLSQPTTTAASSAPSVSSFRIRWLSRTSSRGP